MTNYLVQATNLKKYFGDTHAVDGVSLQIKSGEIYGLVGADGAGKTTTMRLLVGALHADSGEANICGYDINKQTENARSQLYIALDMSYISHGQFNEAHELADKVARQVNRFAAYLEYNPKDRRAREDFTEYNTDV